MRHKRNMPAFHSPPTFPPRPSPPCNLSRPDRDIGAAIRIVQPLHFLFIHDILRVYLDSSLIPHQPYYRFNEKFFTEGGGYVDSPPPSFYNVTSV